MRASSFSFHSIFDFEPRKSKRVAISLEACWTALDTSCRSTLLTTSKENSWATGGFYVEASDEPVAEEPGSIRARGRARDPSLRSG